MNMNQWPKDWSFDQEKEFNLLNYNIVDELYTLLKQEEEKLQYIKVSRSQRKSIDNSIDFSKIFS
ncbi:hypothetical protein JO84_gp174 [Aureococcus anophagefferens virus]|uniref:Uncharacterized protein n=1 Tax=Aureococcus anophagefferens virus TaxID=1474867 RepID=A0A076FG55_9VIRU|nr:hypothetical protein JO84_gp174 [Aureococcus anophagefferens virus]AII17254.1 hypothetical protein AaV_301 [Aureococcus anophagefferens virus]UOG94215.1 hypothetical protein MKD35_174 [Aureococcus anophagefferens virus]